MSVYAKDGPFAKLRIINKGVSDDVIRELVVWLYKIGDMSNGFREALEDGYLYKITPSSTAPLGGVQVWCDQYGGRRSGPDDTPKFELWRNGDGSFSVKKNLSYG
ncbi:hypothetical protein KKG46_01780 [Patescibacteria group bacterium]|nr:hypothetical protein [Patescibacteria group bacterium]